MVARILVVGCAGIILSGCGGREAQEDNVAAPASAEGEKSAESPAANAEILRIRAAFTVGAAGAESVDRIASVEGSPSVLPPSDVVNVDREGGFLVPRVRGGSSPGLVHVARVALPAKADGPFTLQDVESGMQIRVTLQHAMPSPGEFADGYIVYRDGFGPGVPVLHRPVANGTEDFVLYERAPASTEVRYRLELISGVAGLRLVGNTLEILDHDGAPRLRVAPPFLVEEDGARRAAELKVDGCQVSSDPAPPWGRPPESPKARTCDVLVSWGHARYPALLDPSWTTTGSMIVARYSHTASVLANGRVLAVGGQGNQTSAELYDSATGTWSATGIGGKRWGHTATVLGNGKVLIAGGTDGSSGGIALSSALLYDAATGIFSMAGYMTQGRISHSATLMTNGKVLVAGGAAGTVYLSTAEIYDPSTGTFSKTGNMAEARSMHTESVLGDGTVLVAGGYVLKTAERYDPVAGTWSPTGALAHCGYRSTLTRLGSGKVLIAGGDSGGELYAELFDPGTGLWTPTGNLSQGRRMHAAALLENGRVLVAGGYLSSDLSSAELYDPVAGAWTPTGNMAQGRRFHTASVLGNGYVLMAGGMNAGATAELFHLGKAGEACTAGVACSTGFCVDGVCCNAPCGLCAACTQAKTGLPDGTCVPVADGLDPDNECGPMGADVCLGDGVCNGNGLCRAASSGNVCLASSCNSTTQQNNADTCNAAGDCIQNGTSECEPYVCQGNACLAACSSNDDCQAPSQCVGNKCGKGIANGNPCIADGECESTHCATGICCNTACAGPCMTCVGIQKVSGPDGECGPVLGGTDPNEGCVASSPPCGPDGLCNGQGQCRSNAPDTTPCGATICAGGSVAGKLCKSGACTDEAGKPCGAFKCNPQGTACMTSCSANADCSTGFFCKSATCIPVLDLGHSCTGAEQCTSTFCVGGMCCDDPCEKLCHSCSASLNTLGTDGTCAPVKSANPEPGGKCTPASPTGPCDYDGNCDGKGKCTYASSTTACGLPSCSANGASVKKCDGYGACQESSTPCTPYACDSSTKACKSQCTTSADCAAGAVCDPQKKECATAGSTCKDTTTEKLPDSTEHSCVPYTCEGTACRTSCDTSANCAPGYECKNKTCQESSGAGGAAGSDAGTGEQPAAPAAQDSGGCGCRVASSTSSGRYALLLLLGPALILRRRNRGGRRS